MPLEPGKSRAAFEHNVREMVEHGHPQAQAVAAAYRERGEDAEPDYHQVGMTPSEMAAHARGLTNQVPTDDEHIGFQKLEHEIAAKGEASDPRAVAASIGIKKYGKEAMERKAQAAKK